MSENTIIAVIAASGALIGSFAGVVINKLLTILESYWTQKSTADKINQLYKILNKNTLTIGKSSFSLLEIFNRQVPEFAYGAWRDDLDSKINELYKENQSEKHLTSNSEKHMIIGELYSLKLIEKEFIESEEIQIKANPRFVISDLGKEIFYKIKKNGT
ncbi:MAG: hypothetical protein CVU05_09305 [Bacteroidetes bacterium HGW-Bacteroidetes-21]|jgi:hypothetical protein|nr:MAG: hypothetical protein CVU05_09305 [Bacteroidetes bacterium HGW-Bacteroidetes-21]